MSRQVPKKYSKNMFNVDFTDELLKEKRAYEAFGKNEETMCK
jgi:uncharacterized protein with von Willebrand factor type A (vWA) domain